jgi:hypothetical protein
MHNQQYGDGSRLHPKWDYGFVIRYWQLSRAFFLVSCLHILMPAQGQEWITYKPSLRLDATH